MEKGIKIKECSLTRFSAALHAQFQKQMYNIIDQWHMAKSVINVDNALMTEWKELIAIEVEINREVTASSSTATLAALDKERDDIIIYIFSAIRTARRSPISSQKEAAERLYLTARKYSGLQNESCDEETIHIDGLIHDLNKEQNLNDMKDLMLDTFISTLEAKNNEYRKLRLDRTTTRAENKLPSSKEVRVQSDALFLRICQLIEVSYLISKLSTEKEAIAKLADKLNQQISEIVTSHKQTQAQSSGKKKATDMVSIDEP